MAEQIAERLLTALDESSPSSKGISPSSTQEQNPSLSAVYPKLRQWNDNLENELLSIGAGRKRYREEDPTAGSPLIKQAADKLHGLLFKVVSPSVIVNSSKDGSSLNDDGDNYFEAWETDKDAEVASWTVANSISKPFLMDLSSSDLVLLAELLRAIGLFMRWHGQVLQSSSFASSNGNDDIFSNNNPTMRLKGKGMLLLYCKILEMETPSLESPDAPRFASICLFRATYGNDALTVAARKLLINSLDGCVFLMKALMKGNQPISRLFSVLRNVHHLISAVPMSVPLMDSAIETLESNFPEKQNEESKDGLLEVLVATLAWAVRSQPPFPGDENDRRSEMVLEILRALFAMDAGGASKPLPSNDTMTRIGIILCELLKFPNSDGRVYQCKLSVVALLLNSPKEYSGYLVINEGIKPLIEIMKYQLSVVVVERTRSGADDAAAVVPILLVLCKIAQSNQIASNLIKEEVFPPDDEGAFEEKARAEVSKKQSEGKVKAKNMAPLDAPKGTLRWKLIRLMTWTESNVKRSACELLWTLCGEDSTQFVLRTGFGNAIHFLGMKGFVNLPAGVDI